MRQAVDREHAQRRVDGMKSGRCVGTEETHGVCLSGDMSLRRADMRCTGMSVAKSSYRSEGL